MKSQRQTSEAAQPAFQSPLVVWLEELRREDVPRVGGKNASLGEMINHLAPHGVQIPPGFATTAEAYWHFVEWNGLRQIIVDALAEMATGKIGLEKKAGSEIRDAFLAATWPPDLADSILSSYQALCRRTGKINADVAVRSSATAEDLPDASFAGQQDSFLNIRGTASLLNACRRCYASLFTDRAISYRQAKGFDHQKVALSIGIQAMIRSDLSGAGVMFSVDTETGFDKVIIINASWGLGENVVQGAVDPDEYQVFKPLLFEASVTPIIEKTVGTKAQKMIYTADAEYPTRNVPTLPAEQTAFVLTDREILKLARWANAIECHYGCPMDMEWAKDGESSELFIVQARPETVQSRRQAAALQTYQLKRKGRALVAGLSIGEAIAAGPVCLIEGARDIDQFVAGSILVTKTTDPDWVPIMRKAVAIVTDHGGRTSHAAIVSRELGLPAIVGAGNATQLLHNGQKVTVSCAEGEQGFVYDGLADYESRTLDVAAIPQTRTKIMLNLADPAAAFRWWRIPADGVGLARMEFVISNHVKIHPLALARYDSLGDENTKHTIAELTAGYADKREYFVDRLSRGLARIAAAYFPQPVIVRMSDFKTNEYANLIGGASFEPSEENPMLGFRGASRYYSPRYRDGFALECSAIRRLRDDIGFHNVIAMIPFCRSTKEADRVLAVMAENGLKRGENGLQVYVMCEIPSNVILARQFAERFDGFSIGSNDLTQLTLGVDRDSEDLAGLFDEQDEAVRWMIATVIREANAAGSKVGLCGQAPSDHPEFAEFLVHCGIDSISVSPDSFVRVKEHVAQAEAKRSAPR
jgi:pyruvate, water dikinase